MADLLPPNATPLERAASEAAARIGAVPVPVGDVWDPDRCPAPLLPYLAWALSVDVWRTDWPEATQRRAIREAIERHRRKGSVASVRAALDAIGYTGAAIVEGTRPPVYDGTIAYDGTERYGSGGSWAEYTVEVEGGLTAAGFALIRETLATVAPVRCRLVALSVTPPAGGPVYDGTHTYDGTIDYS